jgi:hypothetical protein
VFRDLLITSDWCIGIVVHVDGDPEPPNVFTVHKKAGHDRFTHDILFTDMRNRWVLTLSTPFVS